MSIIVNKVPRSDLMASLNGSVRVVTAIENLIDNAIGIVTTTSGTNTGDNAVNSLYSGIVTNATHTGEVTGATTLTITAKAVTLAKMADVATATVFYRKTAGTGAPEVNTLATLKTDLGLTPSYIATVNTTASITLPTTPTVIVLPTTSASANITYNNTTGIMTMPSSDTYHLSLWLNCLPSGQNKNIYFYAEANAGAGWVIERFSARSKTLANVNTEEQLVITMDGYFPAGLQLRFYVWGEATVYLKTVDLPGTTAGTATVAAARMMWTS